MAAAAAKGMNVYEARLASFSQLPKKQRRSSSISSKATQAGPQRWPLEEPSPESLAQAGFFWRPVSNSTDNAMCYLCHKSLDGWEPTDEPILEHLKHSPLCGWAVISEIGIKLKSNAKATIQNPKSEEMIEARVMTFGGWWPYERKREWRPKAESLARAGFHYNPNADSNDFVSCIYCNLGLDGWEQDDEPMAEHERRQSDCRFFTWKKPRASRASITSRARSVSRTRGGSRDRSGSVDSTTSNVPSRSVPPPAALDSDSEAGVPKAGTKRGVRGRQPSATTTKRRLVRGKEIATGSDLDSIPGSPPPQEEPSRRGRPRKRSSSALGDRDQVYLEDLNSPNSLAIPKKRRTTTTRRGRQSTASSLPVDEQMYDSDASVASNISTTKPGRKASRGGGRRAPSTQRGGPKTGIFKSIPTPHTHIPDDEEIDRALALDLERSDGELDVARFTKPFVKTPRNPSRVGLGLLSGTNTNKTNLSRDEYGGSVGPKMLFSLKQSRTPATPSPTKARLMFQEKDLDFSLPISIPKHLAAAAVDGADQDERPVSRERKGKGDVGRQLSIQTKAQAPSQPSPPPAIESPSVRPAAEDVVMIMDEKEEDQEPHPPPPPQPTFKRPTKGRPNKKTEPLAPPPAPAPTKPRKKGVEPAPTSKAVVPSPAKSLKAIRQSLDGGMLLFDGGKDSDEDSGEEEKEEKEETIVLIDEEPEPEPEPGPVPTKRVRGGRAKATKGKKTALREEEEEGVVVQAEPELPPKRGKKPSTKKEGKAAAAVVKQPEPEPEPEPEHIASPPKTRRTSTRGVAKVRYVEPMDDEFDVEGVEKAMEEEPEQQEEPQEEVKPKATRGRKKKDSISSRRESNISTRGKKGKAQLEEEVVEKIYEEDSIEIAQAQEEVRDVEMAEAEAADEAEQEAGPVSEEEDEDEVDLVRGGEEYGNEGDEDEERSNREGSVYEMVEQQLVQEIVADVRRQSQHQNLKQKQKQKQKQKERQNEKQKQREKSTDSTDVDSETERQEAEEREMERKKEKARRVRGEVDYEQMDVDVERDLVEMEREERSRSRSSGEEEQEQEQDAGESDSGSVIISPKKGKKKAQQQTTQDDSDHEDEIMHDPSSPNHISRSPSPAKPTTRRTSHRLQQPPTSPKPCTPKRSPAKPTTKSKAKSKATTPPPETHDSDATETAPSSPSPSSEAGNELSHLRPLPPPQSPTKRSLLPLPTIPSTPFKIPANPSGKPNLVSAHPWSEINIEALLLEENEDEEKQDKDEDAEELDDGDGLSPEEREMTVSAWVKQNADLGERRFKEQCERMIGRFWEQGMRAVKAIEGIGMGGVGGVSE